MQNPGLIAGGPGAPPPMKKVRREVPLPSQEGKKGAMQYALYVFFSHMKNWMDDQMDKTMTLREMMAFEGIYWTLNWIIN